MCIDKDTRAAKSFYREVRKFAETVKPWSNYIRYQTKPDEIWDITLVSSRVYGRRDEYLAVLAAAGLDTVTQPMPQQTLILPTDSQLTAIKRRTHFESIANYREDFAPAWETV